MKNHRNYREIKSLREKGFKLLIPELHGDEWRELAHQDPTIPRSYAQLKWLGQRLFDPTRRRLIRERRWEYQPSQGLLQHGIEECGEGAYYQFFAALSNPYLSSWQRLDIEADLDADTPSFENSEETTHFILRWTNSSPHADDNIADSNIITATGDFLETAWTRYHDTFGKDPYVPPGSSKIEVTFHDISGFGVSSPPDGPIQLDAWNWVNQPGIRQPTSAHELFHKLQYAFGYRTTWTPVSPYKWFSEGTASWSEVFVWGRTSGAYKIEDMFSNPGINLYDASYRALPFWIFFQARQQDNPANNPLVSFMQKYETSGNEDTALQQVISEEWPPNNVYNQVPTFFALFSRERTWNAWRTGPSGGMYPEIRDPDENILSPALTRIEVPLGKGDTYSVGGNVPAIGSVYYRFNFAADADNETLTLSIDGSSTGDFTFYLVWEKGGSFQRGVFPFGLTEDYSFSEVIDRDVADSLTVIVSGRGAGGPFTLNASVS